MLSEAQIKRLWESMLGAEIRAKYFADFSAKYLWRQQFGTWFTLFFASGSVLALLLTLPTGLQWIRLVLAAFATATSIYQALAANAKKSLECSKLQERWGDLHLRYRELWENVYVEDALARLKELDAEDKKVSNAGGSLCYHEKTMAKWELHTVQQHGLEMVA